MKDKKAILDRDSSHLLVIQESNALYRTPPQTATLKVRNVSSLRDDEFAQIESRIETFYKTKRDWRGVSIGLTREAAIALAAELVGVTPSAIERAMQA